MATGIEYAPRQSETEQITAHVLWMTIGLSCEGDSVAMTSATNPSLEDIIQGVIPGMPRVVVQQGNFATEYGSDHRCLVKLGCKGPVVKCNVPVRGWVNGVGGCPGRVFVVACEPEVVQDVGFGLSEPVSAALERAADVVLETVAEISRA
jgi:Ni,Fe-hydrogenase I small subunit